jgi:multimeric flavodoxin WrbA
MATSGTGGKVLGLGCGQPHGSAEILLKAALRAAEDESADVELVRLDELRLPSGAAEAAEPDDAWWLWEQLVECDGLIVSTPIISRTVAARLKLLGDRLLGPNADAAIIAGLLALRREGREPAVPFRVDERVLKPRVAGFLAVGGSLTPQWKTLTLPIMHTTTFSMHIAVVDQVQFAGAGTPRSVVLDAAALDRAAVLGRNVASQLGVAFDEARYLGPPGLCPMCHLDVIALYGADVECATCGARGQLGPGHQVTWTDLSTSVISMEEKQAHAVEIQETAERHRELRPEIDERARASEAYDRTVRPGRTPASGLSVRRHYLRPRPRAHHHRRRRRPDLEPLAVVGSRKKFVNDSNRNSKDGILVPKPPSFFSSEREVVHVLTHVPRPRPGRPRSGRRERRRPPVPPVPAAPGSCGALR